MILKANTTNGPAAGVVGANGTCAAFKGIPYAKAARFAPPEKPDAWTEERLCDKFSPATIQSARFGAKLDMSEDTSLTVNVWTAAEKGDKLPVMVWIYGGGFQGGTGSSPEFDGENLTTHGVVSVNFNYRVGVMGFFAHEALKSRSKDGLTGNYGILDEIAALQWVHDNIAEFGGDPDNVLIYGQSAGGISCRILLASPMAKGLVHKAIVESGGGLNEADPVRPMEELMDISDRAMKALGWTIDDVLTRDPSEVSDQLSKAAVGLFTRRVIGVFQPCVDGAAITEVPGVAMKNGDYNTDADIICGTVAGDSWMFSREVTEQLGEDAVTLRGFSYSPSQSWAKNQVLTGRKPIHTYYFERTQKAPHRFGGDGVFRYGLNCPHGSEIVYVFGNLDKKRGAEFDDLDRSISDTMIRYWTNFAKTGDPNGEGLPVWPLYTADSPVSLHVSDDGIAVENIVDNETAQHVVDFTIAHPGMLEFLDGYYE